MSIFVRELELRGSGLRVAVKDTIDIAGYPTQAGSRALAKAPPAVINADVVQRVLDAGCMIVGKTNLHELAFGVTGINSWTGTAINPHYPDLIPGGSSSGSAASVAAGMADFALGTDTGGSIRVPATCCGVYGLKPTYGRVSRRGVMPTDSSLDCVGPFARDIDMLIAAMGIIDGSFGELPPPSLRVAFIDVNAESEISRTVDEAVERADLDVVPRRLPGLKAAFEAGLVIINSETWAAVGHLVETGFVGADIVARVMLGRDTTPADLIAAEHIRRAFTDEVDRALADVDALLLPTMPEFPMTLEAAANDRSAIRMTEFVRPFNLSGHPALSIPLVSPNGMPAGIQLVGRKGEDEVLCGLARHIARRLP